MVPTGELWRVLHQHTPLALLVLEHEREADDYRAAVVDIAERPLREVRTLDEAIAAPNVLVWFFPPLAGAAAAVQALEARRDSLLDRTQPLLLALHRDGPGMEALAAAPGLTSWLASNTVDGAIAERGSALAPDEVASWETDQLRRQFEEAHDKTPEQWLAQWRSGAIEDRGEATWIYHHALALERPEPAS